MNLCCCLFINAASLPRGALLPDDAVHVGEGAVGQAPHAAGKGGWEEEGDHSSVPCCVEWHMT